MLFVLSVESRMETGQKRVERKHKNMTFIRAHILSKQQFEHLTDLRVTSVTLTTSQIVTITEVTETGTSIRNCWPVRDWHKHT